MADLIEEPVCVATALSKKTLLPERVLWRHHIYTCTKCTMQYQTHNGATLIHVFFMTTNELCMHLLFNTKTLGWTLQEVESL